jgi:hypothetical protein
MRARRVARQETARDGSRLSYSNYVIDFVHVDYLPDFISQHVLPFARQVSARIEEATPLLVAGAGGVKNSHAWTWAEISQRPQATP